MEMQKKAYAAGSRDESWGPDKDGMVVFSKLFPPHADHWYPLTGTLVLTDGSVLVTSSVTQGETSHFSIAKLNPLGELDKRFAQEGLLTGLFVSNLPAYGGPLAQGADGRIYMLASSKSPDALDPEIAILCIDETGKRNEHFGNNGQIIVANKVNDRVFHGGPRFLRVLQNGDLLVGANGAVGPSRVPTAYLMKLDANGCLVASFGSSGIVDIKLPYPAMTLWKDACVLADGRILGAGYARLKSGFNVGLLVMLNSSGSFNQIFGDDPKTPGFRLFTDENRPVELNAVTERTPGKFLAAGTVGDAVRSDAIGLLSGFDAAGKNDPDFNGGVTLENTVSLNDKSGWHALFAQGENIYVAGGSAHLLLASFKLDGTLNPAFAKDGVVEDESLSVIPVSLTPYSSDRLLYGADSPGIGRIGSVIRYYRV
ncbi:putative Delta-60 repeat protein [Pseudomonas sp. IT-347P]|uniref:hypothetical protein n=1 Tax=Pseudomonas sp. IT-347P TaxID=3026458 RepID=UPI0039DFAA33